MALPRILLPALGALTLAACAQERGPDPRIAEPLPAPGVITPGAVPPGAYGPQDAVLRGAAYAVSGPGGMPPGARMVVRVYDASTGGINDPVAEQVFTRPNGGALPWPYELRLPLERLNALRQAAVAARVEGPDGQPIYVNRQAVFLREGGSDDIPMVPASGAGFGAAPAGAYGAAGIAAAAPGRPSYDPGFQEYGREVPAAGTYGTGVVASGRPSYDPGFESYGYGEPVTESAPGIAEPGYGIPDYSGVYGAPRYDAPLYPGESFGSPSLSAPPLNVPGAL